MRALIINEVCGTGSTGKICTDLATALEEEGCEVKIAFGRHANVPDHALKYAVRIGNDLDVRIHAMTARLFDNAGFSSTLATRNFIKWAEDYQPDIIHLHNLHGYFIHIGLLFNWLKRQQNIKIIWTLHDCWPFTGHSAYCDAVKCEKWKYGCGGCPLVSLYPKSYLDRSRHNWERKKRLFSGIKNMRIVTPSLWLAKMTRESFLASYPVQVINNGIDTKVFTRKENKFRSKYGLEDKILVLSVATVWNDLKGYSDFIELALLLNENYRIILVGGFEHVSNTFEPHNIIKIKKTKDIHELVELYNAADVYLNLTYCDTYPTVNLESVACGTPVISYDTGGSTESALKYGGVVVKQHDLSGIIKALHSIENLHVKIQNRVDIDRSLAMKKYMEVYKSK